jgi:UDP-N-acetylmuramate dehydrogenase
MSNQEKKMPYPFEESALKDRFGEKFDTNVSLAKFTSARVGGPADGLLIAESVDDLVEMVGLLWEMAIPFCVLGGGSNVLVSDDGVRGIVLLNQARKVKFDLETDPPRVWAASGSNFGLVARMAAARGLAGLEWAAGIPGTIGGAVTGNAGAHGGDIAGNLVLAEILHREQKDKRSDNGDQPMVVIQREEWPVERLEFGYRSSRIKRESSVSVRLDGANQVERSTIEQPNIVVLAAMLHLAFSTREAVETKIDQFVAYRRQTQPPGASMGSMFKNPLGDHAGRLIEEAGLKGTRVGDAAISSLHANFFINYGHASADDIWDLIHLAQSVVENKFGVRLELEIELLGLWQVEPHNEQ